MCVCVCGLHFYSKMMHSMMLMVAVFAAIVHARIPEHLSIKGMRSDLRITSVWVPYILSQSSAAPSGFFNETKMIPMRDGVLLNTLVLIPINANAKYATVREG